MSFGVLTPSANTNLISNSFHMDFSEKDPKSKELILESAHVKHNYNVNLYHHKQPSNELNRQPAVPTRPGHKKNFLSVQIQSD